ncbi:aspartate 1-decarboxylase [uncultured Desulfosarcina sp.]|uniref:aspartate 1-decarboxylase n=1 Tax=uncultured Desulfosarcina sp. TaxID=218289 RepID=UPI0029C8CEE8|nr:aspartate 1-decarboxylase [uncultured Desulfosarcina sp.]
MTIYRTLLKAKIHRAVVTHADLHYEGSITIDAELLNWTGIREFERVQVVGVENGARLETYVIAGPCGSGTIQMNGPAARLVNVGDHIIIMAYAQVAEPITVDWQPNILQLDDHNHVKE